MSNRRIRSLVSEVTISLFQNIVSLHYTTLFHYRKWSDYFWNCTSLFSAFNDECSFCRETSSFALILFSRFIFKNLNVINVLPFFTSSNSVNIVFDDSNFITLRKFYILDRMSTICESILQHWWLYYKPSGFFYNGVFLLSRPCY